MVGLPSASILEHVVDVHCHPTDAPSISAESMDRLQITVCAMSSRSSDQPLVRDLATKYPQKVIPCFGYHPWFSHCITLNPGVSKEEHYNSLLPINTPEEEESFAKLLPLLPVPISLDSVLAEVRQNLNDFPNAMLGEVGLDRAFRIPYDYYTDHRVLTPFTVPLDHQLVILEAQLKLAVALRRNISLHSVKAQSETVNLLNRMAFNYQDQWRNISLDMHSCGVSPQMWRDIEKKHSNIFLSLSTVINSRSPKHRDLIDVCSPNRILAESDFNDIDHCAERTWDMISTMADVKGWTLETEWQEEPAKEGWGAVRRLKENWRRFQAGNHQPASTRKKERDEWYSGSESEKDP